MTSKLRISPPALAKLNKPRSQLRKSQPRVLQRLELAPRCQLTSATKARKKSAWKKFLALERARRPRRLRPRPRPPKSSIKRIKELLVVGQQPGFRSLCQGTASAVTNWHIQISGL